MEGRILCMGFSTYYWIRADLAFALKDLEDAEARRLEVVASRLRSKRQAGEDRKKEKEVKLTDRMPTMKRARCESTTRSA